MIRIIICDDDADMLNQIKETAEHVLMQLNIRAIINTYTDHRKISSQLLQSCDLALLDIDFGSDGYNGMDLARRFRERRTDSIIIFITNFIEYAPEGYEVQAFRYILKNDLKRGLQQAIPEALHKFALEKEIIKIQINGEIIDLPICQILYLEVQQHYTTLYVQCPDCGNKVKSYEVHTALSNLEKELEPYGFLRIHRSYLVNMKYIRKFQIRGAMLYNGTTIRVSEANYAKNKQKFLFWKGYE